MRTSNTSCNADLAAIMKRVSELLTDGLSKGFFELRIKGDRAKHKKNRVRIDYSPTEQYTFPEEDNERG